MMSEKFLWISREQNSPDGRKLFTPVERGAYVESSGEFDGRVS
ncbi:hypothetical protein LptCag_0212 [Leptospirillum ferriphilum]|uniref:Uncharacterized protein n=1 Tax=Leptospirillum ferriphilum TaxID=178606 RepID=A0A094X4X1_9BACT|nr:hypothetical protein LptCag_0212 [Leptospirillum ferriphilum]